MSNNDTPTPTAAAKVLAIPELLERILLEVVRYDIVNESPETFLPSDR